MRTLLATLVMACSRRSRLVVAAGLLLALGCAVLAPMRLGIDTDTDDMFSAHLPWRQRSMEFDRLFPQFRDLLVVVIDSRVPEAADATAAALAARLAADTEHFRHVSRPDALPFFAHEGLLFLDPPDLQKLLDGTIDAQPFLGQLVADPSARGLFAALSLVGMGVEKGQDLTSFLPALARFHASLQSAVAGKAEPLSWQSLLGGDIAAQAGPYRIVLAQPVLDHGDLQPGAAATDALRAAAAGLEFVHSGLARVRLTGDVALADAEFATLAQGAGRALTATAALVLLLLFAALRDWRLVLGVLLTLVLGLLLTTGFAALAVGTLNLVSVAFAVLFVGIAVDFAIQFAVRFRAELPQAPELGRALGLTAWRAGGQILIASAATACGFLAFVPTDFAGVAQLGLIAGVGMLIAFVCTLTFLPALIHLLRPRRPHAEVGIVALAPLDRLLARRAGAVLGIAAALALLGLALLPRLGFDSDPLDTKDPRSEAVVTLRDLAANPLTTPYSADMLVAGEPAAAALAQRLGALHDVANVLWLASFVPQDQADKLAAIADAASILGASLNATPQAAPVHAADLRLAAQTAEAAIAPVLGTLPPAHPLRGIAADLHALAAAPDATLLGMNAALTRFLPDELDMLRTALAAEPVTLATLPPAIVADWRAADGRLRVQAVARAQDSAGIARFAAAVRHLAPDASGAAVIVTETTGTILAAFRGAALAALVAIAAILLLTLHRRGQSPGATIGDAASVLAALLLAALGTVICCVLLGVRLNFANIIALPLLLGVGVSFNIYFVMNWRAGQGAPLASPTARAVLFSALTTGTAFGSLALSHHPGTASMGKLLLLSLGCTLLATLLFLPALLAMRTRIATSILAKPERG